MIILKNSKPDLVHCWDSLTAIYCVPDCRYQNIKLVNGMVIDSPRNNVLNKYWLRARLTFPFSDIIIGNSKVGLKAYNAPEHKNKVIYNGFNFNRNKTIQNSMSTRHQYGIKTLYVVGMVASFSKYKDYKTYFSAAQLILNKRKDITFLAIGKKTDSMNSKCLIDTSNLKNFRLLGEKAGIEALIESMDLGVLSTYTEGISNSILEYMALGKPVVATSGGGTNEIILDNITGFLVSPSNPAALAEKIEILLNDSDLRQKMGYNEKKHVQKFFSIERMTENFIETYKNLVSDQN